MRDRLFHLVVEDLEMLLLETGHGMVRRVAYRDRNQDQSGIDAQISLGVFVLRGNQLGAGGDRHLATDPYQGQQSQGRQQNEAARRFHPSDHIVLLVAEAEKPPAGHSHTITDPGGCAT